MNTPKSNTVEHHASNESDVKNDMYAVAVSYTITYKWPVFPLIAGSKKPATRNGFKDASLDETQVRDWFPSGSAYNIGIPTGSKSGIVVLDSDEKPTVSGAASLALLEAQHGPLPSTLRSNTGGGGEHIFFRFPEGANVRNRTALLPGLDVRGEGGYIVAPGSRVNGGMYIWQDETMPIAELPDWLYTLITENKVSEKTTTATPGIIKSGSRNDSLLRFAAAQMHSGHPREKVTDVTLNANLLMCETPLPEDEVLQIVENVYRLYQSTPARDLTDIGNGKKMAELHGARLRYLLETKDSWLQWTGVFWNRVSQTVIKGLSKDVPASFLQEATLLPLGPEKSFLKRHAAKSSSNGKLDAAIELFKSEPGIGISISDLDNHDYLFAVQNGIVDLKTGNFLPPDPALLITQVAGTIFDKNATCPRWEKFLDQVMGGDPSLSIYLQRAIGYAMTGSIKEQCLFFAYGFGANGKWTFLNVVRALFGDLGMQSSSETLMETKRSSSGTSPDIARLRGKRFVSMSETDDGRHLNEGMLKSLTGGDPIIARDLYESIFEFNPTHKFFLASNHKPTIKGTDHGVWRRIRLIPFNVTISPEQRNPNLEAELREELPGILNWAIKGCLAWQQDGMTTPKAIEQATKEYRDDMDIVGSWISEFCEVGVFEEMKFDAAYKSFDPWCKENYNFSFSKKRLGQMLTERGFEAINRGGRIYKGISISKKLNDAFRSDLGDEGQTTW